MSESSVSVTQPGVAEYFSFSLAWLGNRELNSENTTLIIILWQDISCIFFFFLDIFCFNTSFLMINKKHLNFFWRHLFLPFTFAYYAFWKTFFLCVCYGCVTKPTAKGFTEMCTFSSINKDWGNETFTEKNNMLYCIGFHVLESI